MSDPVVLNPFEGKQVLASAIEIPNAAGGLREAMKIDPNEFHHGDKRYVVLEIDCAKVRFDPIPNTEALTRVHVFNAAAATFVDADLVVEHLEKQKARIALAKDEESGQQRTPTDAELDLEHFAGKHADGLVDGCPSCGTEVAAEDKEAREAKAAENRAKTEGDDFYDPDAPAEPTPINGRRKRGAKS